MCMYIYVNHIMINIIIKNEVFTNQTKFNTSLLSSNECDTICGFLLNNLLVESLRFSRQFEVGNKNVGALTRPISSTLIVR